MEEHTFVTACEWTSCENKDVIHSYLTRIDVFIIILSTNSSCILRFSIMLLHSNYYNRKIKKST